MPAELFEATPDPSSLRSAFSDLSGVHDEYAKFFSDTFDQLESMSLELFARHKCLEVSAQHRTDQEAAGAEHESQFRECMEELRDLKTKVCSAQKETEKLWSEISATHQQFLQEHSELRETREHLLHLNAEIRTMREGVEQQRTESLKKQDSIEEHLKRLASSFADLATAQPAAGNDEQLARILETSRQQQANWQQDRAGLEAELEAERQRTARQNEALTEQRRLAAEQQAELAGELKRMRSLMELLLNHMNQPAGGNAGDGKQASSSPENAALESMLAQFEMLQHDLAQRRAGGLKDMAKR